MISSNFTLESIADESHEPGSLNLTRDRVPPQLDVVGFPASEWADLHGRAAGVASRSRQREENKNILRQQKNAQVTAGSWDVFGGKKKSKKREKKMEDVEGQLRALDESDEKDWNILASKANAMGKKYDFYAVTISDRNGKVFGLEFTVESDKMNNEKVLLKYDYRRAQGWNGSADRVPFGLRARSVPEDVWAQLFASSQATVKKQAALEERCSLLQNQYKAADLNFLFTGEHGDARKVERYVGKMAAAAEGKRAFDFESEREWKLLESTAVDALLPYGVMASLLIHESSNSPYMYAGLQFRIVPSLLQNADNK